MARVSMFRGKAGGIRVTGHLTPVGAVAFERHREALTALYERTTKRRIGASDADVIEYLARGPALSQREFRLQAG